MHWTSIYLQDIWYSRCPRGGKSGKGRRQTDFCEFKASQGYIVRFSLFPKEKDRNYHFELNILFPYS